MMVAQHDKMRFAHQYLENAVISKYLHSFFFFFFGAFNNVHFDILSRYSPQDFYRVQCKLVEYLEQQPFDDNIAFELPWVLSQMIQSSPSTTR